MGRAAKVLGVAQPALSRQMRLLEESLGVPLFMRTPRGVNLTEEGEQLCDSITRPINEIERALLQVGAASAPIEGTVVLGLTGTVQPLLAIPLLNKMREAFPKVTFHISEGPSRRLSESLLRGDVDMALVHGPLFDERLFGWDVLVENLVLIGGAESGLSAFKPICFGDLGKYPLIVPGYQETIPVLLEKTSLIKNSNLTIVVESNSIGLSKEYVAQGGVFTIMPYSACAREIAAGSLKYAPIVEPALPLTLMHVIRRNLSLPRGFAAALSKMVRQTIAELVEEKVWPAVMQFDPSQTHDMGLNRGVDRIADTTAR